MILTKREIDLSAKPAAMMVVVLWCCGLSEDEDLCGKVIFETVNSKKQKYL